MSLKPGIFLLGLLVWPTGCSTVRVYWGDVHGHTALSDGKGSVADYLTYARDVAGLDFAVVTDHDFGHSAPWRMSEEEWTETQRTVQALDQPGVFVAIAGYEWTSQPKYWSEYRGGTPSEGLFEGPPRYFNHKNVYFPHPVPYLFSAKDSAYRTPDLLAAAVAEEGGLVQNNHPDASPLGRDQWDYTDWSARVIVNTEIMADTILYEAKRYDTWGERTVDDFLEHGGRTGFVGGSDTHEGHPAARTAIWARRLDREAVFEALRKRHCYAVNHARIGLRFQINGRCMGEEIEIQGNPKLEVLVKGTDRIAEVKILRNGLPAWQFEPNRPRFKVRLVDEDFDGDDFYYVRVTQADVDLHGNPSRAWSSPIWVRRRGESK